MNSFGDDGIFTVFVIALVWTGINVHDNLPTGLFAVDVISRYFQVDFDLLSIFFGKFQLRWTELFRSFFILKFP